MNEQLAVQKLLRRKLAELQARNPAYSVRAFATRLGLSPAAANEILKGQRRVSPKMAARLAKALHLDPSERAEFLGKFPDRTKKAADAAAALASPKEILRLSSDQFEVISDWLHFAILNLVKTADARAEAEWMAERFGVTTARAAAAVERLRRLGLLEQRPDGNWRRTYARVNTTDDVLDVSVQKSHLADLELARTSLLRDPIDRRDFSSLMIALDPAVLPRAKEILRRAQDEIHELAATEPATEVYRLATYLFPLTRPAPKAGTRSPKQPKEMP